MRVEELFDLSGRTALVTGGGRGIGRHLALGLAEAGADVIVASRKQAHCDAVASEIEGLGRRGSALTVDLERSGDVESLVERALQASARLDILVNNAATLWGAPTLEFPLEGWDKTFAVNVRGLFHLSQLVARHMRDAGGGSIIHVSSISGLRGAAEEAMPAVAYNASKGAVVTLTKDMAVKLARHGIRVNGIAPGPFDTDMMSGVHAERRKREQLLNQVPQRRFGGADDAKGVAVFLASDAAAFVTGHTLVVDGGMSAW
jgi:gluconate 5-dehydrogenase